MIFVHSNAPIEIAMAEKLSLKNDIFGINLQSPSHELTLQSLLEEKKSTTLIYSYQSLQHYKFIESFAKELNTVEKIIEIAIEQKLEHIILLSYPSSYYNSANLFLQLKGEIERKFVASGLSCCILCIQAISDTENHLHNLHSLFFEKRVEKYVLPWISNRLIHSIELISLCSIIERAASMKGITKYDVFDTALELKSFFNTYSPQYEVRRFSPVYLYFKSFIGRYTSPTMLELFLMTSVPLYKFRTEKAFNILLHDEQLELSKTNDNQSIKHPLIGYLSEFGTVIATG